MAIVGESGSGKSITALSILKLLPTPPAVYNSGKILFSDDGSSREDILQIDEESLRALANRRAATVKEWFAGKGGIASERMFVVAPKLTADGIQDKGAPTRVEFAIR